MPLRDRANRPVTPVVIRSSWAAAAANVTPVAVVLLGYQIWQGSLTGTVIVAVVMALLTALMRYLEKVELTAEGLNISRFRTQHVAWHNLGELGQVGALGAHELRIFDVARNTSRRLPAPRGVFGVGREEVAQAEALIGQWWAAHGGGHQASGPYG